MYHGMRYRVETGESPDHFYVGHLKCIANMCLGHSRDCGRTLTISIWAI